MPGLDSRPRTAPLTVAEARARGEWLEQENRPLRERLESLQHPLDGLKRQLLGRKSERRRPEVAPAPMSLGEGLGATDPQTPPPTRRRRGRRHLVLRRERPRADHRRLRSCAAGAGAGGRCGHRRAARLPPRPAARPLGHPQRRAPAHPAAGRSEPALPAGPPGRGRPPPCGCELHRRAEGGQARRPSAVRG